MDEDIVVGLPRLTVHAPPAPEEAPPEPDATEDFEVLYFNFSAEREAEAPVLFEEDATELFDLDPEETEEAPRVARIYIGPKDLAVDNDVSPLSTLPAPRSRFSALPAPKLPPPPLPVPVPTHSHLPAPTLPPLTPLTPEAMASPEDVAQMSDRPTIQLPAVSPPQPQPAGRTALWRWGGLLALGAALALGMWLWM